MLFNEVNDFNWTVDNYGATLSATAIGAAVTAGANNAKGTPATLLSAIAEDAYGISMFTTYGVPTGTGANDNLMVDLLVDHAGGTSWSTKIENLMFHQSSLLMRGVWYYFPIFIPAGTSIGAQAQTNDAAATAFRMAIELVGKPSRPDAIMCGSKVQTFGVNTATSRGTTITPGSTAMGSYTASLGTLDNDSFWWQVGLTTTSAVLGNSGYFLDVAVNATNKVLVAENFGFSCNTGEQLGDPAFPANIPVRRAAAGQDVYVRAACTETPVSGISCSAYAVS